jgi:hypothetical protein
MISRSVAKVALVTSGRYLYGIDDRIMLIPPDRENLTVKNGHALYPN